jgi:hypothetical protein
MVQGWWCDAVAVCMPASVAIQPHAVVPATREFKLTVLGFPAPLAYWLVIIPSPAMSCQRPLMPSLLSMWDRRVSTEVHR